MTNNIIEKLKRIRKPYALAKKFDIDLSLSENPLGCSPAVQAVLKNNINISHYPDAECFELKKTLSEKFNVSVEKVSLANGSEQFIELITKVLLSPGDEAIIPEVTFPLFENNVIFSGAVPIFSKMKSDFSIDLNDIRKKINNKTKLIFLCNPNNPTGKILDKNKILEFINAVRPINVVVDEANIEFGGDSTVERVNNLNNLIVFRTFSKAFGLAGLRIGICFAPGRLIKVLDRVKQPFAVNVLAQKCAVVALKDDAFIQKTREFMDKERKFLIKELKKRNFQVIDSFSNNILIRVDNLFKSSTRLVELLNKNDISVVCGTSFGGLGDKFIRVSPRLRQTNEKFLRVIDQLLDSG